MLKKYYKNKVRDKATNYAKKNCTEIKVISGKGMFNERCHHNSVQEVICGDMVKVVACVCMSNTHYPFVHFINIDKNGNYVDNTLGYKANYYNYHKIRDITKSEFKCMDKVLENTKKHIFNKCSNKFISKIIGINYNLF